MSSQYIASPNEIGIEDEPESQGSDAKAVFLDGARVLTKCKRLVAAVTFAVTASVAVIVQFIPDTFQAQTVILPPQQQQSSLSAFAAGALGTLAGSGMASQLGLKNPADLYIGLLKSRTISDEIIRQFHLESVYKEDLPSRTRTALLKHATFRSGVDSFITISVDDHDPVRASSIANAFVNELYKQTSRLAFTDASQRRFFFEQQIKNEKDSLSRAEKGLQETQRSTGLLMPGGQSEVLLRSTAEIRAGISSRQVALQSMRTFATDENAQVQLLKKEISTMQGQLAQLESKNGSGSGFEVSVSNLPNASLEYLRKLRELKYHETLYELLAKQYEAARIDEAKEGSIIQVIDRAQVPDHKSAPARTAIVCVSAVLGLILVSFFVLVRDHLGRTASGS